VTPPSAPSAGGSPPAGHADPGSITAPLTVGVTGTGVRATVTPWGDVAPYGGPTLRWDVAADDRWHVPADETAVRQRRIEGTPVVETRLRVPDGDAVQRVWSVADAGGLTIVEVENESPLPFAVAFSGSAVVTERPPADVPIRGIDLPSGTIVLPVGHRSSIRVVIPHDPDRARPDRLAPRVAQLAPHMAVVRGWQTVVHQASRLVLPDEGLVEAVTAARCDLLLEGPVDAASDPIGFLLDVAELGRLGDGAEAWMPEIVEPIAAVARSADPDVDMALRACERLAITAADDRAAGDIARLRVRRLRDGLGEPPTGETDAVSFSDIRRGPSAGRFVAAVETLLADARGRLLGAGIPRRWLGSNFEVHGIPTGPRSSVSYAVRWHGDRPAVLWEQQGDPQRLTSPAAGPGWSTLEPSGEALWAAAAAPTRLGLTVEPGGPPAEPHSFG
jgi:hypothetical protein